jgi:hypothetical protein
MALWNREIARIFGNAVPERLQVSDLLSLGQLREPGWLRNRRVLHRSTSLQRYRAPELAATDPSSPGRPGRLLAFLIWLRASEITCSIGRQRRFALHRPAARPPRVKKSTGRHAWFPEASIHASVGQRAALTIVRAGDVRRHVVDRGLGRCVREATSGSGKPCGSGSRVTWWPMRAMREAHGGVERLPETLDTVSGSRCTAGGCHARRCWRATM